MRLYQPESGQDCKGHPRRYFRNRFRREFRCLGSIHSDHSHIGPGSIPKDRDISRLQSGCRCRRYPLQVVLVLIHSLRLAAERWNQIRLQRWSIFRAMRCRWFMFQQWCDTDYFLERLNIAIVAIIFLDHRKQLFFDYFVHFEDRLFGDDYWIWNHTA